MFLNIFYSPLYFFCACFFSEQMKFFYFFCALFYMKKTQSFGLLIIRIAACFILQFFFCTIFYIRTKKKFVTLNAMGKCCDADCFFQLVVLSTIKTIKSCRPQKFSFIEVSCYYLMTTLMRTLLIFFKTNHRSSIRS